DQDWKQRRAARELGNTSGPPPEDATPLEAMEHRLRTEEGTSAYASRSYTVEPVFGDTKENRGFRRFMRRGLVAADGEAGLIFAANNLLKIFHHNPSGGAPHHLSDGPLRHGPIAPRHRRRGLHSISSPSTQLLGLQPTTVGLDHSHLLKCTSMCAFRASLDPPSAVRCMAMRPRRHIATA
ncbi:MAG: transposase, partial [Candidatus Dormibacteraceae bacterium]